MVKPKILPDISKEKEVFPTPQEIKRWGYEKYCDYHDNNTRIIIDKTYADRYFLELKMLDKVLQKAAKYQDHIYIPYKYPNTHRITTFNVHNFINYCSNETPKDIKLFKKVIENIKTDIICLQELVPLTDKKINVFINDYKDIKTLNFEPLIKKMEQIGFTDSIIGNAMNDKHIIEKQGCYYLLANGIFSKEKFKYKVNYQLTGNRQVNVVITNQDILIINLHLEYSDKYKNTEYLQKKHKKTSLREIQVQEVIDIYNTEIKKHNKLLGVLIAGDFNNSILTEKKLKPFLDKFNLETRDIRTRLEQISSTDYVIYDDTFKRNFQYLQRNSIKTCTSDHFPIVFDYALIDTDITNIKNKLYIENLLKKETENEKQYFSIKITNTMLNNSYLEPKGWFGLESKIQPIPKQNITDLMKLFSKKFPYYQKYLKYTNFFYNENLNTKSKKGIEIIKSNPDIINYLEDMLLQYVKTIPNMKTIILWPTSNWFKNVNTKKIFELLCSKGKIFYSKDLYLDGRTAQSLIYQIYIHTSRNKTLEHLNFNLEQKGWENIYSKKLPVKIIFYEYLGNQKEISGSEAKFKNEIRNVLKTPEMRIYDILHINDTFQEAIDNSSLFLNQNSLEHLSKMNISRLIQINKTSQGRSSYFMINTLKKTLFNNFDLIDINRFIFNSSMVLYSYCQRANNDIDGYIFMENLDKDFKNNYQQLFYSNSNDFFNFFDLSAKDTPRYQEYITKFYNKIVQIYSIPNYEEVIFNPKYHFYFFGLKINILQLEIIKKIYRFKPKGFADLIALNKIKKCNIKFPKIPKTIKYYYKDEINEDDFLQSMSISLSILYKIELTPEQIKKQYFTDLNISTDIDNYNINSDKKIFSQLLNCDL
jgi:endonuclease/exonuclease/phosphatase family metal-dependent hydrolase